MHNLSNAQHAARTHIRSASYKFLEETTTTLLNNHPCKQLGVIIARYAAARRNTRDISVLFHNFALSPGWPAQSRACVRPHFPMNNVAFVRARVKPLSKVRRRRLCSYGYANWPRAATEERLCRPIAIMSEVVDYG